MTTSTPHFQAILKLPLADHPLRVGVQLEADAVVELDFLWDDDALPAADAPLSPASKKVLTQLARELEDYARHPGTAFHVLLHMKGTPFQQKVWRALQRIPPGATVTYGELARQLGSGARAVANACRRNPIPLIVPCHRVVAQGGIGGYAGATEGELVQFKQFLLDHERSH